MKTENTLSIRLFGEPWLLAIIITTCMALTISAAASTQSVHFEDAWGEAGFNLTSQDGAGVEVVFSIEDMIIVDQEIDGQVMQFIQIPGVHLPRDAGTPNLPGTGRYIAIPQGATASFSITTTRTEIYKDLDIAPSPPIPLDTDNSPLVYEKDPTIYTRDSYYPESPVILSELSRMRGVDCVILGITPFQYNPVTKELVVYRDIRVRVDFAGGNGHFGEDRLRSRHWEPILQAHLLNYNSLSTVNFDRLPLTDEDNCEYVIIVPDDPTFIAWADTIKQWRTRQGIVTGITTLSEIGGNEWTAIYTYLSNAYYSWTMPPVAVLLLSDYQYSGDQYGITSPIWNSYCVSDNMYADVDPLSYNMPDLAIARICAQNENQLSTMIGKMMEYERTPPTDPGFYDEPLIAGGWQSDRWFILCCDVIWGYFHNEQGKNPVREYAGFTGSYPTYWSTNQNTWMIVNYFGPSGLGYIPTVPTHLTYWGANAFTINNAINSGAFLVQHRDHGDLNGWGSPGYFIGNLSGLYNEMYTFVLSTNCLTGKYDEPSEVFAEAFHRMDYGALGIIAASEVSYSFVNDTYQWGVYDCMWPNFDPGYGADSTGANTQRPCFANASGKYYLQASSWPSNPNNKTVTYHLFHHHGDAFITLYSEVPQELSVSHTPVLFGGATELSITANAGAMIALTINDEIVGVATATGSPQTISFDPQMPGQTMLVTATLQNYYRYMAEVDIVTEEANYVVFNDLSINDNTGNNNQLLDLGEDVLLSITVENLGTQTATDIDVSIGSDDEYVTLLDSTEVYPLIPSGSTATVPDGFEIAAGTIIPDEHAIEFTLTATNGDSTWVSPFLITACAPVVLYDGLMIIDMGGNMNGQLDPGETADFIISIENNGTGDAEEMTVVLSCDEPLITIPQNSLEVPLLPATGQTMLDYEGLIADAGITQGDTVTFTLDITTAMGYSAVETFSILVGDPRFNPMGPDSYGYYVYDPYDGPGAPTYSWTEIAPAAGGSGTNLGLPDYQAVSVSLPFTFTYYGSDYDQIAVSSDGWLSFGAVPVFPPLNLNIPNYLPQNNFVAGFWDETLNPGQGGQVCYYDDSANHRFIVEWYHIPHTGSPSALETFQMVLLDPAYYPTVTGDGEIVVHYNSLSSLIDGCTLGLEDSSGIDGLQYLYDGDYSIFAMPLENEFAIKYTTGSEGGANPEIAMTPFNPPITIPATGGSFDFNIALTNSGPDPVTFDTWIMVELPTGTWYGPVLGPVNLTMAGGASLDRDRTQAVPGGAPAGTYSYEGRVGTYPDDIWNSDAFAFEKLTVGDGSIVDGWTNSGEEFSEWLTEAEIEIPSEFSLYNAYPNPFNPATTIRFGLPNGSQVELAVYDLQGRKVAELVNGYRNAGMHEVTFEAVNLASGLYLYRIQAEGFTDVKKMVLIK